MLAKYGPSERASIVKEFYDRDSGWGEDYGEESEIGQKKRGLRRISTLAAISS
jgi:hypothetical protein